MPNNNFFLVFLIFAFSITASAQTDFQKAAKNDYFYTSRKIDIKKRIAEVDLNRINATLLEMVKKEDSPVRAYKNDSLTSFFISNRFKFDFLHYTFVKTLIDSFGWEYDTTVSTPIDQSLIVNHLISFKVLPNKDYSKYAFEITGIGLTYFNPIAEVETFLFYLDVNDVRNQLNNDDFEILIDAYNKSLFNDYKTHSDPNLFESGLLINANDINNDEWYLNTYFNNVIIVPFYENILSGGIFVFNDLNLSNKIEKDSITNYGKNKELITLYDSFGWLYDTTVIVNYRPSSNYFSGVFETKKKGDMKTIVKPVGFGFTNLKYDYSGELLYLEKMYWAKLSDLEKLFAKSKFDYLKRQMFYGLVFKKLKY
jgi:hypothetical protein